MCLISTLCSSVEFKNMFVTESHSQKEEHTRIFEHQHSNTNTGTKTNSIWMSYISNTIALSSYSMLYSLACVSISIRLKGDARRYALVFTANSFVALAIATVLSQTGSSLTWDTNKFYYVAFSASCAATVIPPVLLFHMRYFGT